MSNDSVGVSSRYDSYPVEAQPSSLNNQSQRGNVEITYYNNSPQVTSHVNKAANDISTNVKNSENTIKSSTDLLASLGFDFDKKILNKIGLKSVTAGVLGGRVNLPGGGKALVALLPSTKAITELVAEVNKKGIDNVNFEKFLKGTTLYVSISSGGHTVVGTGQLGKGDIELGFPVAPKVISLGGRNAVLFYNTRTGTGSYDDGVHHGKASASGGVFVTAKDQSNANFDIQKFNKKLKAVQAIALNKMIDSMTELPLVLKIPTNPGSAIVKVVKEVAVYAGKVGAESYYKNNSYALVGVAGQITNKNGI